MTQFKDGEQRDGVGQGELVEEVESCVIRAIKTKDGKVTRVEVDCKTPEARAGMAAAINEVDKITVKSPPAKQETEDGGPSA